MPNDAPPDHLPPSSLSYSVLPEHVYYCFAVLEAELKGGEGASEKVKIGFEKPDQEFPLFVTWDKYTSLKRSQAKDEEDPPLRGCIGTFSPMKLAEGLRSYALTAALHDNRFSPISLSELPLLKCSISLLTPFEDISHPLDWSLEVHGIYISFTEPNTSTNGSRRSNSYSATYLPGVAIAQGWTKPETILSLIRKSGYRGWRDVNEGDELWMGLRVRRYRSLKGGAGWGEYLKWKEG